MEKNKMKFKPGDRIFHRVLKEKGTVIEVGVYEGLCSVKYDGSDFPDIAKFENLKRLVKKKKLRLREVWIACNHNNRSSIAYSTKGQCENNFNKQMNWKPVLFREVIE